MRIYTLDHPPAHVHVAKAGAIVRIDLATHAATEIVGAISDRDVSGRTFMAKIDVTSKDRERYARARARGEARAQDPSAVVEAGYDPDGDLIDLKFGGGGSMAIPRKAVSGLQRASASHIGSIVVSPAGDALSWPSLDVDVYVPGLVERAFGSRLFAAATGRRGGRTRSNAKAAAAKANGAKGGRPRKRLSA